MPVGTVGSVKGIYHKDLKDDIKAQIILGNTYHLYLRPGLDILNKAGGLHKFISWDRPMLTDSGGFQVFSLAENRKLTDEGCTFRSHIDGSKHMFTPENNVDTQRMIGADIIMALDECTPGDADHNYAQAVELKAAPSLPWTIQEFQTPHDDCDGAKRGMNTVRIFHCGSTRVAHLGDLGCFPDEALAKALEGVDCMLIPVGGYYTIGCQTAYQIIRACRPKVAIPMHYRTDKTGFDEISHIDDFMKLWGKDSCVFPLEAGNPMHIHK